MIIANHSVIVQAIELIESRIGIAVGKQFHYEFDDLFRRLAQGDPADYLQKLRNQDANTPEWQRLINTLTIGETYFLREENHFELLKKHILPKLVLHRRQQKNYRLRVWSAGCASGEEPYSIAIILHQFLPDIAKWDIEIYGSDINDYTLTTARLGIYRPWAFRDTDAIFQQNYFNKVEGGYQIKPFVQSMVNFRQQNLLDKNTHGKFDIIFCKNVMLYFDDPYINQVETHLFDALNPRGWLFLGQAEALRFNRDRWKTHIFPGAPIYQHPKGVNTPIEYPAKPAELDDDTQPIPVMLGDAENYYLLAVDAIHEDNNTLAEHYLSLAISEKHDLAVSHTLLAWLFANRKAFPEAEAHIKATLAKNALHADAHYVSAMVAHEQGDVTDAIRELHMTLYCDNYHVLATLMLGNIYAKTGDLPRAYNQWAKVRRFLDGLDPSDYVSDLSDLTVGQIDALIASHLSDT